MEMNPWRMKSEIYEPAWDRDAQKLVWNESSAIVIYLPSSIKTVREAQELLDRSYATEIELPNCPWNVCKW